MKKLIMTGLLIIACASFVHAESMSDGKFQGTANGMDGEISIELTVEDGKISDISVLSDNETAGVGAKALGIIADAVVENQSLAVDNVSGATISSMAMKSAIGKAITEAGGDEKEWKEREIVVEPVDETLEYDVVVVGAGLTGLTAALTAEKNGAKVALLEKLGIVGGTSIFSSGNFLAASTDELKDDVAEAWNKRNKIQEVNQVNMDKVKSLLDVSPEVIALYESLGASFTYDEETYTFCPTPSDKSLENCAVIEMADAPVKNKGCESLIASLEEKLLEDGVDIYLNTCAVNLVQEDDGAVTGVIAESKNGTKTFMGKSIILATGDYARNNDLNAEIAPETVGEYTATAVGNTGDGLTMALDAGAVLHPYQESLSGNFNADPYDMPVVGQPNNQFPFAVVLVDRDGLRKVSEAAGPHDQQVFFIHEDDLDYAWAIMDQEIADRFLNLETYLEKTEGGSPFIKAYKADSIEELAGLIEVDAEVLNETITHYNELCEAGEDTDCGKSADYLSAIDEGPFYAVKEYDMTRGNYGGILTSDDFEVLNEEGEPIPGLYAAGLISSGDYFGDYYPGREALSLDAHAGYIAGMKVSSNTAE
ncbi:MAG: FAD-dependent oxidoreductase [Blautia sp.]|nr:FAD-dependent oxidoreductase [Blautia sp.]